MTVRIGSPSGTSLGTQTVATGGWRTFQDFTYSTSGITGTQKLYVLAGNPGKPVIQRIRVNGNTAFNKIATDFDDLSTSLRDRDYYFVALQSSWARYDNVDLSGISSLTARIANGTTGKLEFRVGSPTGTKIAEVNSNNTGWRTFANYNSSVSGSNGIVTLYLVGSGGHGGVIDYVDFKTTGGSTGGGGSANTVTMTGNKTIPIDPQHDGGYRPVVGVQEHALFRPTNNTSSAASAMPGHTVRPIRFAHHQFLTYWQNKFWVFYMGYQTGDSTKAGYLHWSDDGRTWDESTSAVVFPAPLVTHQRMAFYTATNGRLLVTTWYSQNGEAARGGVGSRLVREIKGPNNFGPIHILKHNQAGSASGMGSYSQYTSSSDSGFRSACSELLSNKLYMQQMWEEDEDTSSSSPYVIKGTGNNSPFEAKAFQWYRIGGPNGKIVSQWKGSWYGIANSGVWSASDVVRDVDLRRFDEHRNAKAWGEPRADGGYAMFMSQGIQNLPGNKPSFGWDSRTPFVVTTSENGLTYTADMLVVSGDNGKQLFRNGTADNKTLGPSYVRGLTSVANWEGKPRPNDNIWLTYSTNKEFVWVTEVPKELSGTVNAHVNDQFSGFTPGGKVGSWNIRNGGWTPVQLVSTSAGTTLRLQDKDRYDFAKAFRVFPESQQVTITTTVNPLQSNTGELHVELVDKNGRRPVRVRLGNDGTLKWQSSNNTWNSLGTYTANVPMTLTIAANTDSDRFNIYKDGTALGTGLSFAENVGSVERVEYRTGPSLMKDFSDNYYGGGTPGDRTSDLSGAHDPVTLARFDVAGLQTVSGIIAPGEGVDPVASGASLSGKTLRVMPMGDSITKGTIPGGYRIYLHNLLSNSGATFDLVGKDSRTGDTTPDKDFWGNDGWQISDTTEVINSISYKSLTGENRSGLYDEMDAAISTTYFSTSSSVDNVILLQIGTNDFLKQVVRSTDSNANRSGEAATERLQALLNRINSLASSRGLKIKVILSQIPEITTAWTGDSVTSTTIAEAAEYRASMSAIANQSYSQLTVSLVDNFSSTLGELADGVHPNAEGYEDMGITFYNGLVASVATSAPPGGGTTAVTIDSVSSGAAYAVVNAINGQTIYIDRDYTLSGLPSSLSGEKLIRTRNDDDVVTANPHLRFTLGQASEVYIAYSTTANSLPSWMTGWSDTGTTVSAGVGGSFKLYKKTYAAGQVSLGGNNRGSTNAVSNYFVIIKANETTPPVTPPSTPSSLGNTGNFTFGTDFTAYDPNQDGTGGHPANATVSGNGSSATITGNVWKKFPLSYTVTSQTMLAVTVNAPNAGEIIGVSLDNDNLATTGRRAFLFGGSQYGTSSFNDWSWSINPVYTSGSGAVTYLIPVGSYFTGSVNHLGLIGDSDASGSANVTYSAVRIYEQDSQSKPVVPVFLMTGQSNMAGTPTGSDFPSEHRSSISGVSYYKGSIDGNGVSGALTTSVPYSSSANYGPELLFAKTLKAAHPSKPFAIVKYARGNRSLVVDFKADGTTATSNDGPEYVIWQNFANEGLQALRAANPNVNYVVSGFLWTQGENDSFVNRSASQYESDLTTFIADVRANHGDIPFFFSRLSAQQTALGTSSRNAIRSGQDAVAANVAKTYLINTDGFGILSDNLHFNAAGQVSLGQAYANSVSSSGAIDPSSPQSPSNAAPTNIALSNSSITENLSIGTVIGTLSSTDSNSGDTHSYSVVGGDSFAFAISGNQLISDVTFNFEFRSTYNVTVRTTDSGGLSYDKSFSISINDVDEGGGGTPVDITIDSVSSGAAYVVVNAINGQTIYIDRDYTLSGLPSSLSGKKLIRTRNDDDVVTANPHLRFTLGQTSEVYIAYSTSATSLPSWMTGWTDTGNTVSAGVGGSFKLYKKTYAAGQVSLGGNNRGSTNAVSNYFVIVDPSAVSSVLTSRNTSGSISFGDDHTAYGSVQDGQNSSASSMSVSSDRTSATISGNIWKTFPLNYTITNDSILSFTLSSSDTGEILGIALDDDNDPINAQRAFMLGGSDFSGSNHTGWSWRVNPVYASSSGARTYTILLKDYYKGAITRLGFIGDDDGNASTNATFSNVRLYEQGAPAAAPTFSVTPGAYITAQSVALSTVTPGATIRFTTNGSNPTTSSGTVYSAPIAISSTTTVKAIAYTAGGTPSSVVSGIYTINQVTTGTTAIAANGNVTLGTDHVSYGSSQDGQDGKPTSIVISQDGTTATLSGNAWKTLPLSYLVTANTMMDVTLESGNVGEILGVALDNDLQPTVGKRAFLFAGSEVDGTAHSSWAWTIMPTPAYAVNSGPTDFSSCCW